MGNPVAYLKINFSEQNAPYAVIMRPGDALAMNGFLDKVSYLEQRL